MALEFNEQLSRLQKPDRDEMTDEEYAIFNKNVETMEKNWGFINNLFKVLPLQTAAKFCLHAEQRAEQHSAPEFAFTTGNM